MAKAPRGPRTPKGQKTPNAKDGFSPLDQSQPGSDDAMGNFIKEQGLDDRSGYSAPGPKESASDKVKKSKVGEVKLDPIKTDKDVAKLPSQSDIERIGANIKKIIPDQNNAEVTKLRDAIKSDIASINKVTKKQNEAIAALKVARVKDYEAVGKSISAINKQLTRLQNNYNELAGKVSSAERELYKLKSRPIPTNNTPHHQAPPPDEEEQPQTYWERLKRQTARNYYRGDMYRTYRGTRQGLSNMRQGATGLNNWLKGAPSTSVPRVPNAPAPRVPFSNPGAAPPMSMPEAPMSTPPGSAPAASGGSSFLGRMAAGAGSMLMRGAGAIAGSGLAIAGGAILAGAGAAHLINKKTSANWNDIFARRAAKDNQAMAKARQSIQPRQPFNSHISQDSFSAMYHRAQVDDQNAQFMKFGQLPPGFEFLPGHMGRLGMPAAVAARGAQPLAGGGNVPSFNPQSYNSTGSGIRPPGMMRLGGPVPQDQNSNVLGAPPTSQGQPLTYVSPSNGFNPGDASKPGTWKQRSDIPYNGISAAVRYNNPGAAWPGANDDKYGILGYGLLKDGENNRIGRFPTLAHGLASNMDLYSRRYTGMTLQAATSKWRARSSPAPSFQLDDGTKINGSTMITPEMAKNKEFMTKLFQSYFKHESGLKKSLSPDVINNGFDMYKAGGIENYKKILTDQQAQQPPATPGANPLLAQPSKLSGPMPTNPGEQASKKFLVLPGVGGTYGAGGKDTFRQLAALHGAQADFLDGKWGLANSKSPQIAAAIERLQKGDYHGIIGYSAGGYNMKHIFDHDDFKKLPQAKQDQIKTAIAMGVPGMKDLPSQFGGKVFGDPNGRHDQTPGEVLKTLQAQAQPQSKPQGLVDFYKSRASTVQGDDPNRAPFAIEDRSDKAGFGYRFGKFKNVEGLTVHHTAGGGQETADGTINTFRARGFPAQYIMQRDGSIVRALPEGARGQHMRNSAGVHGSGYGNHNMEGIEVIARNNKDWTPAQQSAIRDFMVWHSRKHGYDATKRIFGHGELNAHKERDEGERGFSQARDPENWKKINAEYDKKYGTAYDPTTALQQPPAQQPGAQPQAKQPITAFNPPSKASTAAYDGSSPFDQKAGINFLSSRNRAGAELRGVDPKLMHSMAEGIRHFENKFGDKYRVEVMSASRGGNQGYHSSGQALDMVIVDKATGQKLTNFPSYAGKTGWQGTVGDNAPLYQHLMNYTRLGTEKFYPEMGPSARWGGYGGPSWRGMRMDAMHYDFDTRKLRGDGGSFEKGFSPSEMQRFGIKENNPLGTDINKAMRDLYERKPQQPQVVTTQQEPPKPQGPIKDDGNDPHFDIEKVDPEKPFGPPPPPRLPDVEHGRPGTVQPGPGPGTGEGPPPPAPPGAQVPAQPPQKKFFGKPIMGSPLNPFNLMERFYGGDRPNAATPTGPEPQPTVPGFEPSPAEIPQSTPPEPAGWGPDTNQGYSPDIGPVDPNQNDPGAAPPGEQPPSQGPSTSPGTEGPAEAPNFRNNPESAPESPGSGGQGSYGRCFV